MLKAISKGLKNIVRIGVLVSIFSIGLLMMLIASWKLQGKELYVVLGVGGSLIISAFVATVVFAFRNLIADVSKGEQKLDNLQRDIKIRRDEIESRKKESDELTRRLADLNHREKFLQKQLDEERCKAVQVSGFKVILDLAICQMECKITKCFDSYFAKSGQEITEQPQSEGAAANTVPARPSGHFVGALTATFVAKYGIDLKNLKVKYDDNDKTVYFAGAEPSFRGIEGFPKLMWECSIALSAGMFSEWKQDQESLKLQNRCKEKYQRSFIESLQKGPEQPEWIKEPLRRSIRILLARFFARPGYKVQFTQKAIEGFVPLHKYLREPVRPLPPCDNGK